MAKLYVGNEKAQPYRAQCSLSNAGIVTKVNGFEVVKSGKDYLIVKAPGFNGVYGCKGANKASAEVTLSAGTDFKVSKKNKLRVMGCNAVAQVGPCSSNIASCTVSSKKYTVGCAAKGNMRKQKDFSNVLKTSATVIKLKGGGQCGEAFLYEPSADKLKQFRIEYSPQKTVKAP
jgi:hypothetical protein